MDEAPPQPEAAEVKDSFLDKAKNFFTMGGDKDKWTKAIIVSIVVVLSMGLATFGVWGVALAFWYRSIAEPSPGDPGGVGGNFAVIKTMDVYVTTYSPFVKGNECDKGQGGGSGGDYASAADGSSFRIVNGKFQIKTAVGGRLLDHIFAESQDYSIIPRNKWNSQAVQIPGLLGGIPIEVHDVYGTDVHRGTGNNNFLDLSYTCGEGAGIEGQLRAIQKQQGVSGEKEGGILVKVNIVERGAVATGSSMDFRNVGPGLGEFDQVGIWKNIIDVQNAVGKPGQNLVPYTFMGHPITGDVNKAITPALDKVQADLKAAGVTYNFSDLQGANVRENKNRAGTISPHGFGTAIDINPNVNTNNKRTDIKGSKPRDAASCPTNIPKTVSDIFQKNGFFWGAKFYCTCDSMHFMYGGNYDTSQIAWPSLKLLPADKKSSCPTLKP